MTNLRFDKLSTSFNDFKLVTKKKRVKQDKDDTLIKKLVYGTCFKTEEGIFKIKLNDTLNKDIDNKYKNIELEFTEESYNLRGVMQVFTRVPEDEVNGTKRYIRIIRSEAQCRYFPGSKERFVPFCRNWVCSGYLVNVNNKIMFKLQECITPYSQFIK